MLKKNVKTLFKVNDVQISGFGLNALLVLFAKKKKKKQKFLKFTFCMTAMLSVPRLGTAWPQRLIFLFQGWLLDAFRDSLPQPR